MSLSPELSALIRRLPKVELHLHIEGSLEPEMLFALAQKHQITLPYDSVEALRAAYQFEDLQSFLDLYYAGADVLRDEDDFYQLTLAYLRRCHEQGVVHTEVFFDPQTHTDRGLPFETALNGIYRGLQDGQAQWGISFKLIACFLRHLSAEAAMATLEDVLRHRDRIDGVGLDSSERDRPPVLFTEVFARARAAGLHCVAHAGEEGPAAYIREALDLLQVERVDHGVRCEEDAALCAELAARRMPLTVCPLSNLRLAVVKDLRDHNLKRLLDQGLCVTIHSDDPAYFGGYMEENYVAVAEALNLDRADLIQLARNGIEAAFADETQKQAWLDALAAAAA